MGDSGYELAICFRMTVTLSLQFMNQVSLAMGLSVSLLLVASSPALAQSSLRIQASDAISGDFAEAVTVEVIDSKGAHIGVTDENGVVDFLGLVPAKPSGTDVDPTITLKTFSRHFLPRRTEVIVDIDRGHAQLALVSRKFGQATPVISAAKGGKFKLANLGELSVAAGALETDARLWLSVVPNTAMDSSMVKGQLFYELWCVALDADGNPQPGTLAFSNREVSLRVNLPTLRYPKEELESQTLTAYSFDENWMQFETAPVRWQENRKGVTVTVPIAEGFNLIERDYTTVEQPSGCRWTPWKITTKLISVTPCVGSGQGQSIYCGWYSENACIEVPPGMEYTGTWESNAEVARRINLSDRALLAQVSSSLGMTVSRNPIEGFVTSIHTRKRRCTRSGQPIHGAPSQSLTPSGSCLSGNMNLALSRAKYEMIATRTCSSPSASGIPGTQRRILGTVDVAGPLINDWNVAIDPTCPRVREPAAARDSGFASRLESRISRGELLDSRTLLAGCSNSGSWWIRKRVATVAAWTFPNRNCER